MSIYWARSESPYGFFDVGSQIVVIPSKGMPPCVVVDHEVTHVNLVNNSGLGLLERVLQYIIHELMAASKQAEVTAIVQPLANAVRIAGARVHEAVAWFGTELQTLGYENLTAPSDYAGDVRRLRTLGDFQKRSYYVRVGMLK